MNDTVQTLNNRISEYTEAGWRYIPDPTTWSGGSWFHNELGSVNAGGGTFQNVFDALNAIDRFTTALARIS